ncbi:odorant receptor 33b-like [Nilaparvata lugens]|uniref:odorant receptor 33b-like n=1 Tax=Nilaparvata lugens TaxID=108931 RepID=UPI00193E0D14|nr:odorant receptor 33b-like [Nilaparvata lugens]
MDKRAAVLFNSSNNVLGHSSSRMEMDTPSLVENRDYQRCLLYCLKKNVQHHWAIKSGIFLGDVLVGSGLMIVTLSLTLTKSDSTFSPDNIKLIFILLCELLNLFGYCFCGTLVKDKSLSVQTALFDSSWLQLSQSSKKSLQIFQICSTRPIVLKGVGMFEINLECYLQTLNHVVIPAVSRDLLLPS